MPNVCPGKPHCLLFALAGNLCILDFTMLTVSSAFTMTPQKSTQMFQTRVCDALVQTDDADSFEGSIISSRRAPVWTVSLQTGSEGLGNPIKETLHVRDF